jgi:hypothetical protein
MPLIFYIVNVLIIGHSPSEPRLIKFLHTGPNDVPISDITISLKDRPSESILEYVVVVDEKTFNEVESYVVRKDTHLQKFKKEDEYNFRIERINGKDTTFYLLAGQKKSVKYFDKLRSMVIRNETKSKSLLEQLDVLMDRIEPRHN